MSENKHNMIRTGVYSDLGRKIICAAVDSMHSKVRRAAGVSIPPSVDAWLIPTTAYDGEIVLEFYEAYTYYRELDEIFLQVGADTADWPAFESGVRKMLAYIIAGKMKKGILKRARGGGTDWFDEKVHLVRCIYENPGFSVRAVAAASVAQRLLGLNNRKLCDLPEEVVDETAGHALDPVGLELVNAFEQEYAKTMEKYSVGLEVLRDGTARKLDGLMAERTRKVVVLREELEEKIQKIFSQYEPLLNRTSLEFKEKSDELTARRDAEINRLVRDLGVAPAIVESVKKNFNMQAQA